MRKRLPVVQENRSPGFTPLERPMVGHPAGRP